MAKKLKKKQKEETEGKKRAEKVLSAGLGAIGIVRESARKFLKGIEDTRKKGRKVIIGKIKKTKK